ncbi:MAG: AAA family ATPase, partial [Rivularia sp. ALOHA_DT_140]|nr:AAA family ATPase [Rivularia sp. ALOHA_DT_140]
MQSFRGIGDMELDFQESEPNVIIGINGVGKSSILECIAILLSRYTKPVQFPTTSGRLFKEEDISNGSDETYNEITVETSQGEVTWSLSKQRKKRAKTAGSELSQLRRLIEDTHEQLKENPKYNLPVIVHYGVNRAVVDIPLRVRKKQSLDRISAYEQSLDSVQINFNSFFQWFRKLEDLENEQRLDDSDFVNYQLEAVRQAIYSLITGLSNLRIRRSPLRMTVKKQEQEINVHQLSDGEKCLLALVGDLARRLAIANPGLDDPLLGEGIVLIDEIELHLH